MCRLLGYLGSPIQLDRLLYEPEHSLVVQSYEPREMTSGVVNADGFGIGWYHPRRQTVPFTYKHILPIWNDINLPQLSRYIESGSLLGYVRSATPGQALDLSNCQPFGDRDCLFVHNGFIKNFRHTLYKPIRDRLCEEIYLKIHGTTDSEHIFALFLEELLETDDDLEKALYETVTTLAKLARPDNISLSANLIVSNGREMVASRFATTTTAPSLYWLRDDRRFPDAVMIASEPLFAGHWNRCPENSLIRVTADLDLHVYPLQC
ncbi:MAG: ergothioneine biosynthesis protein EgtC [Cyanobacteria bacterium J007]|jgi:ergothioneine biosynthesis protein EgtC|nr:MAG: ergothioneine biosynthesis protein EgtC [Cyanobacteria bacterium J007]